jgi:hypothetical protein
MHRRRFFISTLARQHKALHCGVGFLNLLGVRFVRHHSSCRLAYLSVVDSSVIALTLIIERSFSLRRNKILPSTLLDEVIRVYQSGKVKPEVIQQLAIPLWVKCWLRVCATSARHAK